jgi:hypothetical protein
MSLFKRGRTSAETILLALLYLYFLGLSKVQIHPKQFNYWEKMEEGVMLPYGNGFRDSIPDVYTVVKEYLFFYLMKP